MIRTAQAKPGQCSVAGCSDPVKTRGWCSVHLGRWRRHGSPTAGRTRNGEPARYLQLVVLAHEGVACLDWPYARDGHGYARINDRAGRIVLVSRLVCEAVNGAPPSDQHVAAHTCGRGKQGCVSPRHLEWKTNEENEADKIAHGTRLHGERIATSKLSNEQARQIALSVGISRRELAERYGVARETVRLIQIGKRWSAVTRGVVA